MGVCCLFLLAGFCCQPIEEAAERARRVLIIGIDGCRTDALLKAKAPHLHGLIRAGAFSDKTRVLGDPLGRDDTISGPGWSSILTGVWSHKHGVRDNSFEGSKYQDYPHFFRRLKEARPKAVTVSVVAWEPIHEKIVSAADVSEAPRKPREDARTVDARVARRAAELLRDTNPDVLFVHLDSVDGAGHGKGFSPDVPEYLKAIEAVDGDVGLMLDAMRKRKTFAQEDWLVIVCTDHGGKNKGHGRGQKVPEINQVFLIVSGPSVTPGKIEERTGLVDVTATALAHLGVVRDPAWKLDGRPVGLKKTNANR